MYVHLSESPDRFSFLKTLLINNVSVGSDRDTEVWFYHMSWQNSITGNPCTSLDRGNV